MKHTLRWRAVIYTTPYTGTISKTNPVTRYEVTDERGETVALITNTRASGRQASWQISRKDGNGKPGGDYTTAEDALSALQKEFDT